MNEKKQISLGIIGVGTIGSAHAAAVGGGSIEGMVLGALCDSDPIRAAQLREQYPGVPVYERAEDLLAESAIDAVLIATPHYDHPPLAIQAFRCGKHVLTEKPIGVFGKQAQEMVAAAKQSGKTFAVMFNQRTNSLFRRAKELVESGAIGEMKRNVWIITNWYRTQSYYDSGNWRATWSGEGGGVLMNQAPHNLDLWQWICGMPTEIRADCPTGKFHRVEIEDEATIFARYSNGATGVFITSTGDFPGTNRLEITGTKGSILIEQKTLTLTTLSADERDYCFTNGHDKPTVTKECFPDEPIRGHAAVLQRFADAINFGKPLVAHGEEGLASLAICNAAYLSAWTGQTVSLPLDDDLYLAELQKKIDSSVKNGVNSAPRSLNTSYIDRWNTNW